MPLFSIIILLLALAGCGEVVHEAGQKPPGVTARAAEASAAVPKVKVTPATEALPPVKPAQTAVGDGGGGNRVPQAVSPPPPQLAPTPKTWAEVEKAKDAAWKRYEEAKSAAWNVYAGIEKAELLNLRDKNRDAYYAILEDDRFNHRIGLTALAKKSPEVAEYVRLKGTAFKIYQTTDAAAYKEFRTEESATFAAYQKAKID